MTILGASLGLILVLIAGLHVLWAFSTWPFPNRERMLRSMSGTLLPPDWTQPRPIPLPAYFVVAFLLLLASALVAIAAGLCALSMPHGFLRAGVFCVAGVFLLRGGGGLLAFRRLGPRVAPEFLYWDSRIYSPLCLVLGVGVAVVGFGLVV